MKVIWSSMLPMILMAGVLGYVSPGIAVSLGLHAAWGVVVAGLLGACVGWLWPWPTFRSR